jgi:hypothetical protein
MPGSISISATTSAGFCQASRSGLSKRPDQRSASLRSWWRSWQAFLWPVLLQGLEDRYPTIRWFSRLSLLSLQEEMRVPGVTEALERFDYIAPKPQRDVVVAELLELWRRHSKDALPPPPAGNLVTADYRLAEAEAEPLLALQTDKLIQIGE